MIHDAERIGFAPSVWSFVLHRFLLQYNKKVFTRVPILSSHLSSRSFDAVCSSVGEGLTQPLLRGEGIGSEPTSVGDLKKKKEGKNGVVLLFSPLLRFLLSPPQRACIVDDGNALNLAETTHSAISSEVPIIFFCMNFDRDAF